MIPHNTGGGKRLIRKGYSIHLYPCTFISIFHAPYDTIPGTFKVPYWLHYWLAFMHITGLASTGHYRREDLPHQTFYSTHPSKKPSYICR
uniref:Uncharacterized protein n=1 Tax=Picea glauca TaxID=3330 RepID=A0A117NHT2_PICGL|nr:hypothetical protein ABT39_MTgene4184 [Picea glauca]